MDAYLKAYAIHFSRGIKACRDKWRQSVVVVDVVNVVDVIDVVDVEDMLEEVVEV